VGERSDPDEDSHHTERYTLGDIAHDAKPYDGATGCSAWHREI
jgi:predicted O-linked N-acetylglucosamine transferase (SPINDLY family)